MQLFSFKGRNISSETFKKYNLQHFPSTFFGYWSFKDVKKVSPFIIILLLSLINDSLFIGKKYSIKEIVNFNSDKVDKTLTLFHEFIMHYCHKKINHINRGTKSISKNINIIVRNHWGSIPMIKRYYKWLSTPLPLMGEKLIKFLHEESSHNNSPHTKLLLELKKPKEKEIILHINNSFKEIKVNMQNSKEVILNIKRVFWSQHIIKHIFILFIHLILLSFRAFLSFGCLKNLYPLKIKKNLHIIVIPYLFFLIRGLLFSLLFFIKGLSSFIKICKYKTKLNGEESNIYTIERKIFFMEKYMDLLVNKESKFKVKRIKNIYANILLRIKYHRPILSQFFFEKHGGEIPFLLTYQVDIIPEDYKKLEEVTQEFICNPERMRWGDRQQNTFLISI